MNVHILKDAQTSRGEMTIKLNEIAQRPRWSGITSNPLQKENLK
jgi:hypothetical protein